MIRKQVSRARERLQNDLLEREKQEMSEQKLTFSITYYPAFQNVRAIMEELHILTPNKGHKKVFPNVPVVGFRNDKSLKDSLEQHYQNLTGVADVNHVGKKYCYDLHNRNLPRNV